MAIKKLRNNKDCGLDMISHEMLKSSSKWIKVPLCKLLNEIYGSGVFPKEWNIGYIVSLLKAGNPSDANNYRGITINSALGKVFGIILNTRLEEFLEENCVIKDNQMGFKRKARTVDHLFIVKTILHKYVMKGNYVYMPVL